jgi:predicted ATP-grasp superfamily ATP-dependent carboligase
LAEAARESGYRPLVADFFGDQDTRGIAEAVDVVEGDFASGFAEHALLNALTRLAAGRDPIGLVYGTGYEANPSLLEALERQWTVFGNRADTVSRVKDPTEFAALCARLNVPHPETALAITGDLGQWLRKIRGRAGGGHIQPATGNAPQGSYYQRRIDGIPVSALFIADGRRTRIVGWSRQWCAPSAEQPYRYGGAARPSGLAEVALRPLEKEISALSAELGLKGLNSADYILAGERHWLLEINPRPGAALDVFGGLDLFHAHIAACRGALAQTPAANGKCSASAIVYANKDVANVPALAWPPWAKDRQTAGTAVRAGDPLCTVMAEAQSVIDAMATAQARIHLIRSRLEGGAT